MQKHMLRTFAGMLALGLSALVFVPGNIGCGGASIPDQEQVVTPVVPTPSASTISVVMTPADATADVAADTVVTAVFQSAITEPADWSTAFVLQRDGAGSTLCTSVTYDATTSTATCAHEQLVGAASYTATVSGITDVAQTTATFTVTKATTTLTPTHAAMDVEPTALTIAAFATEIVEPADWNAALILQRDGAGATLCTGVTYDATNRVATCTHDALIPGGTYTLAVTGISNAVDAAATFTIRKTSVTFAPPNAAIDISPMTPVTVQFGDTIDAPADWNAVITLQQEGAGPNLCTSVTYDAVTRTATCAHAAFAAGNHYTTSLIGVSGVDNATATFTASNADKTILPTDASTGLEPNTAVTVTFTNVIAEPAEWSSAFVVQRNGVGSSLCTSVTFDAAAHTATCNHDPFMVGGTYTVTLSGIVGVTNGSATFTIRNTTVTLYPTNNSWDLGYKTRVTATFADPIDVPADWNTAFVLLKNDTGSTKCTSVTYDAATLTATCGHSTLLDFLTNYTVKIVSMPGVDDATSTFSAFF